MGTAARLLMPPKARLQALVEGIGRLEASAHRTAPIAVFRVAQCGHEECGCRPPAELPEDALLIQMGCQYLIPAVTPPEGLEAGYQSRVERSTNHGIGRGLGPEGVKAAIRMIDRLQLLSR